MPVPFVTYIPLMLKLLTHLCGVITKHREKVIDVANTVWPGHQTEVEAAFTNISAACDVISALEHALRVFEA